jgi:lauroyl/myristoyl acyltransferase
MALQGFFNSRASVQASILMGKYLPPSLGYRFSEGISSLLARMVNLPINRAIRTNQYVANGETSTRQELVQMTNDVLEHAGKCFYDLYHFFNKQEKLEHMVPFSQSIDDFVKLSQGDQGYIVVSPHLSNFDLVVCGIVHYGFKGRVLSYPNPGSGYQLQNKIRASFGLNITPIGDPNLETEIIEYLRTGGVVATAVDRPITGRKKRHYVNFFGRPSPLPIGYITTALAANVPVIVVTAIMKPDGTYGFLFSGPLPLKKYRNKMEDIKLNTEMVLEHVEKFIRMAPRQWLMYYPVWPDLLSEDL